MPIYEYQCEACGHVLDALQKLDDAPLKKCPDCGKPKLKRLLSAPMFLLKGTGWYETDFKSDKELKRNLADRPEADGESKADEKKADDVKADGQKPEAAQGDKKDAATAEKKPESAPAKQSQSEAKPRKKAAARSKPARSVARRAKAKPRRR